MNKKLILLPTLVLILLFAFSMSALSADDVGLLVNSTDISAGSGEGWSYDSSSKTLTITKDATLANANPNTPVVLYVEVTESCNLTLAGVNLVGTGTFDDYDYESVIRFTQGGVLTLQAATANTLTSSEEAPSDAITTFGNLDVKGGGSLKITGAYYGIYGEGGTESIAISISDATLDMELVIGTSAIVNSDGDITITDSIINIDNGLIETDGGNITITDSIINIDKGIIDTYGGNITISGASKVDVSIYNFAMFSSNSADTDVEVTYESRGAICARGDITFNGPVEVQADSSRASDMVCHGILAFGKIEFKLTEGGSVTGLGSVGKSIMPSNLDVDESLTIPAGMGIASYMYNEMTGLSSSITREAEITLAEKNMITQPAQGEIISGNLTVDMEAVGNYKAIGKDNEVSRIGQVQYPKLNTEDHFGYIVGYPDKEFKANNSLTRAECAAMFARLSTGFSETGEYSSDFKDVPDGSWSAKYIGYLAAAGIIQGYGDGTYRPDNSITRAEFTAMTINFFKWTEVAKNITFKDVPKTHWAYDAINTAYNFQFIKGYSLEKFGPDDNIKRCDVVLLLNRALQRDKPDASFIDGKPAGLITFPDVVKGQTTDEYYYGILEAANSHDYTKDQDGQETWLRLLN